MSAGFKVVDGAIGRCCEMFGESEGFAHDMDCPSPLGADTWQKRAARRQEFIALVARKLIAIADGGKA